MKFQILIILGLIGAIWIFHSSNGPRYTQKDINNMVNVVDHQLDMLRTDLANHTVRNANIIIAYGEELKIYKPQFAALITNLEKDATPDNPSLLSLQDRLQQVKRNPKSVGDGTTLANVSELHALLAATTPQTFNNSLIDTVNVLADLSEGKLPRINAPPESLSTGPNQPGSQLVGNPTYGQWVDHGGTTFWEWYGAYAMFRDLFGGRNYEYGAWTVQRPWSYYNDMGRDLYASQQQQRTFNAINDRHLKSYGADGTRRNSFFSKKGNSEFVGGMQAMPRHSGPAAHLSSGLSRRSSSFGRRRSPL